MEPTLDSLIASSAPPVAGRTPALERELAAVVAEAEAAAAPSRPVRGRARRRLAFGAGVALGVVALGSGASAAGLVPAPHWAPWYAAPDAQRTQTISTGGQCEVRYGVKGIVDPAHPATAAEQTAAVAAGREFLHDFDFSRVDVDQAAERVPATALTGDESRAELESFAVQLAVQERLDAELARRGLPATVSVSAATWCREGAR